MRKQLKKIVLVAVLAFCLQPMSISADCNLPDNSAADGGCSIRYDNGDVLYRCIEGNYWFYGDCNVAGSKKAKDKIISNP